MLKVCGWNGRTCCTYAGLLLENLIYNSLHTNNKFVMENISYLSKFPRTSIVSSNCPLSGSTLIACDSEIVQCWASTQPLPHKLVYHHVGEAPCKCNHGGERESRRDEWQGWHATKHDGTDMPPEKRVGDDLTNGICHSLPRLRQPIIRYGVVIMRFASNFIHINERLPPLKYLYI